MDADDAAGDLVSLLVVNEEVVDAGGDELLDGEADLTLFLVYVEDEGFDYFAYPGRRRSS